MRIESTTTKRIILSRVIRRNHAAFHDLRPADGGFTDAARVRDEIKRLEGVERAIVNDPFAKQYEIDNRIAEASSLSAKGDKSKSRITKSEGTVSNIRPTPQRLRELCGNGN